MPARKLDRSANLSELRREILWSRAACQDDPIAGVHAPRFTQLLEEWQPVYFSTLQLEDAVVDAEQAIARINVRCGDHIDEFHLALLGVVGQDRTEPHYTLYFQEAPSRIKRNAFETEVATLRDWQWDLARETDPRLRPFDAVFSKDVTDAETVFAARLEAEVTLRHSREVGGVAQFFDRVEQVRDDIYAQLDQHRARHPELMLPRDFASRFFLKTPRRQPNEEKRKERAATRAKKRAQKVERQEKRKAALEKIRAARRELAALHRKSNPSTSQ